MVWTQWWSYTKDFVASDPERLGVYELADESKITVYYGSGIIKTRLLDHLNKRECPMARYYRYLAELFSTEDQCRKREEELLAEYKRIYKKLPMYNEKMG